MRPGERETTLLLFPSSSLVPLLLSASHCSLISFHISRHSPQQTSRSFQSKFTSIFPFYVANAFLVSAVLRLSEP